mmetsp:Transcript_2647/g.3808  ORF Transcript_2647/g.3808 Transcript_2647/m.3808 type:complete len:159 (+) Transcript_2647:36-512(+)
MGEKFNIAKAVPLAQSILSYASGIFCAMAFLLIAFAQLHYSLVYLNENPGAPGMSFLNYISLFFTIPGMILSLILIGDWVHKARVHRLTVFIQVFLASLCLFIGVAVGVIILIVQILDQNNNYLFGSLMALFHPIFVALAGICSIFSVFMNEFRVSDD